MRKLVNAFFLSVVLILFLAACGSKSESDDANAEFDLVEPGYLTIVSSGGFIPFTDMKDGEMVGYDIDVGREIANILGLEPKFVKAEFSGMITGIQTGRYDLAINSHTITEERKEQVNFTHPYYYSGSMIFSPPGSDIKTVEDLKGKTVALNRSSNYYKEAQAYTDKFAFYDDDLRALQAVAEGHGDAGINDAISGQTAIAHGLKLEAHQQFSSTEQAIPIHKEKVELLQAVNKAMDELRESGKLKELSIKWIGFDVTEPPEDIAE
ncbi:transporter substrate-binding domain-containing protein [Oceanobacillus sp. 143]|uniref:Amino acid ABC transporter substrate-binding protein n=1 Tax=Oceanobacillus zhaokaii TaxID=2052660 RepID=A0A345PIE5_9BACI|nr:transporter substrate-binding domain-containing protein [Oceanobacillus zhaokaii]AXI09775.1 amino acid ABC transporter substrate-binding protein [Oceanobacillus zhaokaii]QGS69062.1 transporter substrate-binding domain-containing protein [Oceanobacillus sp. 143]